MTLTTTAALSAALPLPSGGSGRWALCVAPNASVFNATAFSAVLVNGTLLVRSAAEHAEGAAELVDFARAVGLRPVQLDMSELAKADGALSCCSILF